MTWTIYQRDLCLDSWHGPSTTHLLQKIYILYYKLYYKSKFYIYTHTHIHCARLSLPLATGPNLLVAWDKNPPNWTKFPSTFKLNLKMKWKVSIVALNSDLLMLDHISFYRGFTALCIIINHSRFCWAYECNIWITGVLFSVCTLWLRSVLSRILSS